MSEKDITVPEMIRASGGTCTRSPSVGGVSPRATDALITEPTFREAKKEYTIEKDGDYFERKGWHLFLRDQFLHYEKFWQKFVVPRTKRPESIHPKEGLPFEERRLMMLHYTIFMNLYLVDGDLKEAHERKNFENMYIRLSSAGDVCEEFLFRFLIWLEIHDEDVDKKFKEKLTECVFAIGDFHQKEEPTHKDNMGSFSWTIHKTVKFNDVIEKNLMWGRSFSVPIISKNDVIQHLLKKRCGDESSKALRAKNDFVKKRGKLFQHVDAIRAYRNIFVHSWQIFRKGNEFIRKETFSKNSDPPSKNIYRDWGELLRILEGEDTPQKQRQVENAYGDMKELIRSDFDLFLSLINDLWKEVVGLLVLKLQNQQ